MKQLFLLVLLLASLGASGQVYTDTQLKQHQDSVLRGNSANNVTHPQGRDLLTRIVNSKLSAAAYNRITDFGNATLADEIITFTGVKAKFGNSTEIGPLSGSDTLTAPDADPLNFRVDYLVVNRDGTTEIITGQPGLQGLSPVYDADNQIPLYSILVNDRGTGTVTPVTYATQIEANAGILTNVAMSPNTTVTLIDLKIDEALAGIMAGGSGGHILKYNGTAITQRGTLRVLQDSDVLPDNSLRDSSAITESILDLRPYLSRFGTATGYPISGYFNTDQYGTSFVTPTSSTGAGQFRGVLAIGQKTATIQTYGIHSSVDFLANNEFGSTANWIPLRIIASRRDTIGGVWPTTATSMGLYWDFTPSYNQIRFGTQAYSGGIGPPFRGLVYDLDYSANYTARSLVDKGYVDAAIAAGGGGGGSGGDADSLAGHPGSYYEHPLTTKGDIFTFSTTKARLPVGTDGYALTANSSQTTGLIWSDLSTLYFPLQGGSITGTGGAGFIGLIPQSSAPSTPASGVRLYSRSTGAFSWKGTNGFERSFVGTGITADRTYTLPDASGTLALLSDIPAQTYGFSASSISGSVTIDLSTLVSGTIKTVTGDITSFNCTGGVVGKTYYIYLVQDATGSRTITGFDSKFKFQGAVTPYLNAAASSRTLYQLIIYSSTVYDLIPIYDLG